MDRWPLARATEHRTAVKRRLPARSPPEKKRSSPSTEENLRTQSRRASAFRRRWRQETSGDVGRDWWERIADPMAVLRLSRSLAAYEVDERKSRPSHGCKRSPSWAGCMRYFPRSDYRRRQLSDATVTVHSTRSEAEGTYPAEKLDSCRYLRRSKEDSSCQVGQRLLSAAADRNEGTLVSQTAGSSVWLRGGGGGQQSAFSRLRTFATSSRMRKVLPTVQPCARGQLLDTMAAIHLIHSEAEGPSRARKQESWR